MNNMMDPEFLNPQVHPILIALNNIKQEIDFIVSMPEYAQLPEGLRTGLLIMLEEFAKVKGPKKEGE